MSETIYNIGYQAICVHDNSDARNKWVKYQKDKHKTQQCCKLIKIIVFKILLTLSCVFGFIRPKELHLFSYFI